MLLHPLLHRTTNPLTHTNGPSFLVCVVLSCSFAVLELAVVQFLVESADPHEFLVGTLLE